jgi:hypothetical protein
VAPVSADGDAVRICHVGQEHGDLGSPPIVSHDASRRVSRRRDHLMLCPRVRCATVRETDVAGW